MTALVALVVLLGGAFAYLQQTEPGWWARLWYPLRYTSIVRGHAAHYHLDPALLAAVIETESKFNAGAHSSAGAVGLMQLTPSTAQGIAQYTGGHNFRLSDLTNPEINVRYGAWYLRHLLDRYSQNERLAPAARPRAHVECICLSWASARWDRFRNFRDAVDHDA